MNRNWSRNVDLFGSRFLEFFCKSRPLDWKLIGISNGLFPASNSVQLQNSSALASDSPIIWSIAHLGWEHKTVKSPKISLEHFQLRTGLQDQYMEFFPNYIVFSLESTSWCWTQVPSCALNLSQVQICFAQNAVFKGWLVGYFRILWIFIDTFIAFHVIFNLAPC